MDHITQLAQKYKSMAPTSVQVSNIVIPQLEKLLLRSVPKNQITVRGTSIYCNLPAAEQFVVAMHKASILAQLKQAGHHFTFLK
jgi:lambda repressor-like predicted transcriptional regulator